MGPGESQDPYRVTCRSRLVAVPGDRSSPNISLG